MKKLLASILGGALLTATTGVALACSCPTALTASKRIWDPADVGGVSYSLVNVGCQLAVMLTKSGDLSVDNAADVEIAGAAGCPVQYVCYETKCGTDPVGWDILTSDGVDHVVVVGNQEGQSGQGIVQKTCDGWVRRTFKPENFMPPITANEVIATANVPDNGYNNDKYAGAVSAVELVYNTGTANGGAGKSILRNISINGRLVRLK